MHKIIISRTDNLGDVVLSLPIAGKLKQTFPDCKVIFIGKSYTEPLINACIYIDDYWDSAQLDQYDTQDIDAILFLFPDLKIAKWAEQQNIPLRIGTSHRWWHWVYCNERVNFTRRNSDLHEIQLNAKLLKPLGVLHELVLEEASALYGLKRLKQTLPEFVSSELLNHAEAYKLVLHPKSKGSAREWPAKNYYVLAKSLPSSIQVFLTGTALEEEMLRREAPELLVLPNVTNLMGKLTLVELLFFLSQIDALVACSTGPLHIAAALGKYAIGIYPNLRPMHPGRWKPVGKYTDVMIYSRPACNECENKPTACSCIQKISISDIKNRLLIAHTPPPEPVKVVGN